MPLSHVMRLLLPCLLCAMSQSSRATLGAAVQSVQTDEAAMSATRTVASHGVYEVHQLVSASGTTVREFANADGLVFGVAWQGPFMPDLNQLLGASFQRLQAAANPRMGHRRLGLHAADLIVDSGGKMRGFAGRAYLPALVPATVSAGEIQ